MANGYSTGMMGAVISTPTVIPQNVTNAIRVNENTPNLQMIQSFPVVSRNGNVHIHQDPVSGQMYEMTDEFHSMIPQILTSNSGVMTGGVMSNTSENKRFELKAISLDPINIMSSQMDKISSLNYIRSNSQNYVDNLANQNAAANDMFYFAALNSRENQGSFFYLNENGFSSKESVIFDNQIPLMQDSAINSAIERGVNQNVVFVVDSTSINSVDFYTNPTNDPINISNKNIGPIRILGSNEPVKFTYPSSNSITAANMNRGSVAVSQTNVKYVYPLSR